MVNSMYSVGKYGTAPNCLRLSPGYPMYGPSTAKFSESSVLARKGLVVLTAISVGSVCPSHSTSGNERCCSFGYVFFQGYIILPKVAVQFPNGRRSTYVRSVTSCRVAFCRTAVKRGTVLHRV